MSLGPNRLGEGSAGRTVSGENKGRVQACLLRLSFLAIPPALLSWEPQPPAQTGRSCLTDRGRGVLGGGCEGWGLPRRSLSGLAQWGEAVPSPAARPRGGVTHLNPGCKAFVMVVPVARLRVRPEISAGPDGPSAPKELEDLEQARVGTDAQYLLFQTRTDFPVLGLSLTGCLAFSESLPSPCFTLLGSGVEGRTRLSARPCSIDFLSF